MSFCNIIKETMEVCADVTYEIQVQSVYGGQADPEVSLIVNDNSINQQGFLPRHGTADEQSWTDINKQVAEISRLQCIYHLKTETAFNEFQRMKEIYRDKDVDVRIMRRQGGRTWILMPKQQRWLLDVDVPPSEGAADNAQANVTYFDEPASPDYDELLDDIYIPERIPDRVGFSPYEGDDEQDEENLDEIVLNPCPNPSIFKRRRRRSWEGNVEAMNEAPTEEECNLPKRIRRDSFGFFNFVDTREGLYDLNSDDEAQDAEHELLKIADDLLDSDYRADNEDDLSDTDVENV